MAPIAQVVKALKLGHDLMGGFAPGNPPEELDDVAELAHEGASPVPLDADVQIVIELEQVESGRGTLGHGGPCFPRFVKMLGFTLCKIAEELGHGHFGLTEN